MCICVRVWYICVFMCIHVCVCTWLHVWTYWYAHICVCIGVCVFPIFIWHFNPSSIFLYIIYIAHCAIILLCTLMLYICDRSTPDLNKDDELYIPAAPWHTLYIWINMTKTSTSHWCIYETISMRRKYRESQEINRDSGSVIYQKASGWHILTISKYHWRSVS